VHHLLKQEARNCNLLSESYHTLFSAVQQLIQKRLVEYLGFIPPLIDHDNRGIEYSRVKKRS